MGTLERPRWVDYGCAARVAGRRVYRVELTFGLVWRPWITEPSFVRAASTRAVGQELTQVEPSTDISMLCLTLRDLRPCQGSVEIVRKTAPQIGRIVIDACQHDRPLNANEELVRQVGGGHL